MSDVMGPLRDIATVSKGHACTSISPSGTTLLAPGTPLAPTASTVVPTPALALTPLGGCPWGGELWDIAEMGAGSLWHPARCPHS